jgi:hypothetical protein
MATLKIATIHDHYITQIKALTRMRTFEVPKDLLDATPGTIDDAILAAAFGLEGTRGSLEIHLGDFEGQSSGIVLEVERETGDRQCWVVPEHSVFLIADNGRTIDRL